MNQRSGTIAVQKIRERNPNSYRDRTDQEMLAALQKKHPGKYDDLQLDPAIPKTENLLQRAMRGYLQLPTTQAIMGGVDTAGFGAPGFLASKVIPQDIQEMAKPKGLMANIGRGAGNIGGFVAGGPEILGSKVAKGISNPLLRGMARGGAGMAGFAPVNLADGSSVGKEIGKTASGAVLGGATETLGPLAFKALFRKNILKSKADELGQEIGKIKESVASNPNSTVDAQGLWYKLRDIYDKAAPEVQRKLGSVKRWMDDIEASGGRVHPDFVRQMEDELGSSAKFMGQKSGFLQWLGYGKPKSPSANRAMQESRSVASGRYDDITKQYGYPQFTGKSKEYSSIMKKFPDDDPSKAVKSLARKGATSALGGYFGGLPGVAISLAVESLLENPVAKQAAFKFLSKPSVARAGANIAKGVRGTVGSAVEQL